MNVFSKQSLDNLEGVDSRLQDLAFAVLPLMDCKILEGRRTEERQRFLVSQGLSKTMNSKHLDGKAIDIAPFPIDWSNTKRYYYFAGLMEAKADELGINIRWGGNWDMDEDLDDQTFMDLVHFEVVGDEE